MLISMLVQIPVLALSLVAVPPPTIDCLLEKTDARTDELALAHFRKTVNRYVELHRRLEAGLPSRTMSSDAEQNQRAVDALAAAIRDARLSARPGSVFTPQVADVFRRRIATAVRDVECDIATLLDEMEEAGLPGVPPPVINGSLPWGLGDVPWPSILWRLPRLPDELEYRFVGRHIVLLDVHANLVVDILENAVPWYAPQFDKGSNSGSRFPALQAGPCDVHPELATCWS
jgi:hypothetical protein